MTKKKSTRKKSNKPSSKKTLKKSNNLGLYANIAYKRQTKKDKKAREHAEYLASLPKSPVKRFFWHLNPKRVFKFWFSKRGLKLIGKTVGVMMLLGIIGVGSLFMYYRKDLDAIRPGELAKRVQSTVNRYEDRNGVLLWEDKGTGNYKLVVEQDQIAKYVRDATVAIEDKDFYKHGGVSLTGIARAAINNLKGGGTQGGSTLTQQLIKQVYFSNEANNRDLSSGLSRKIKEMILAVEVERMYDKDQIITLYLNESPYGGRRNGVESGAQTYFGKSAKDLNLAESAMLAAIPNNPSLFDPYFTPGNERLIARQHMTLDNMVDLGFITKEEAAEAKEVPVLDQIRPMADQFENIKAPHYVIEVQHQLEAELGVKVARNGGLTIKTSLDYEAQKIAEEAVANGQQYLYISQSDNIQLSSVDTKTGQVIAMVGSVDWNAPGYGQTNAATSPLEPGSSIKPVLDYAPLFQQRPGVNYGPGSILKDENIDKLYCGVGAPSSCHVQNYTGKFYGNVTIRQSLASSLNIPAIKALYINGPDNSVKTLQAMGDKNYCAGQDAFLSAAIGGGCTVIPVEHANTYATLARGGTYKPLTYILEVSNTSGDTIMKWEDPEGEKVLDPQVAYMVSDILADPQARASLVWGSSAYGFGFVIPDVWTAVKTGTTENGNGKAKDLWVSSYSTSIATTVWNGNHDGSPMMGNDGMHTLGRHVVADYMERVHKEVYQPQDKWHPGDKPARPDGIKNLTVNGKADIWPSWFDQKNSGMKKQMMTFDSISRKKASSCTPDSTKIEVEVEIMNDPITKKDVATAEGFDTENEDDVHKCDDVKPYASISGTPPAVQVAFRAGTFPLSNFTLYINGAEVMSGRAGGTITIANKPEYSGKPISVKVTDQGGYEATITGTYPVIVEQPAPPSIGGDGR